MQRTFPKVSALTWHNQDLNSEPPDPEAKCLPLDHNTMSKTRSIVGLRGNMRKGIVT